MSKFSRITIWVFAACVVALLGLLAIPQYSKVRPESVQKAHINALRHIAQGIVYFANAHDGEFPATLSELGKSDPHIREIESFEHGDIIYLKPQRKLSECSPKDIILISTSKYGTTAGFIDGTGAIITAEWKAKK